ncbi:MAG: extracellular solute-binding protein [Lachnospiraceae bacterium]|nr:extracellular solute-binding protein [Lachnospiraceae bacterium]
MKKRHKISFLWMLIISFCVLFAACAKEEETVENLPPWTLEKYSFTGMARENFLLEDEIAIISVGGIGEYDAYEDRIVFCSKTWSSETGEVSEGEIIPLEDALLCERDSEGHVKENYFIYDFDYTGEYIYSLTEWTHHDAKTQISEYVNTTIKIHDKTGNLVENRDLSHLVTYEEYEYNHYIEVREDGNIYLFAGDEKGYTLYLLHQDGSDEKITELEVDPENYGAVIRCEGNTVYFINEKQVFYIDDNNKVVQIEAIEKADNLVGANLEIGIDIAYNADFNIYGYSFEAGESELLLKDEQVNYDGYVGLFSTVYIESRESLWGIVSHTFEGNILGHMYPSPDAGDISDRTVIRYVKLDPWQFSIQSEIADFNASNTEYYIETVDLSGEEDPLGTLSNRIAAGEQFDFVELSSVEYTSLANKGVFEDLNPYIANSETVNLENLEETFLNALEMDGALYEVAPYCYFYTICANTEYLEQVGVKDAENGWNREQYIAYMRTVAPKASGVQLLANALPMDINSFVNYSDGICDFTNEDFYSLLESCSVGQTADMEDNYEYVSELNTFRENHFLVLTLTPNYICEVQNYIRQSGDMALIGYPSEDGNGRALLSPALSFGMFAHSEHKDVVWDFLEVFLSYEYQKKYEINFGALATRKDVVDEMFAMMSDTENFGDAYLYGQNCILGEDFGTVVVEPLTAEEVAEMETLIYGANERYQIKDTIYNIIMEEAAAYFMGQKSAEEVAEIIENRVSIYLEE